MFVGCGVFGARCRDMALLLIGAAQCLWICCELLWATLSESQRHEWCTERVDLRAAAIVFWASSFLLASVLPLGHREPTTSRRSSNAIDATDIHTATTKKQLRARRILPRVPLGLGRGLLPVPL